TGPEPRSTARRCWCRCSPGSPPFSIAWATPTGPRLCSCATATCRPPWDGWSGSNSGRERYRALPPTSAPTDTCWSSWPESWCRWRPATWCTCVPPTERTHSPSGLDDLDLAATEADQARGQACDREQGEDDCGHD